MGLSEQVVVLPEPLLEFRYGQALQDPHDGLSMFGPYDSDQPSHPKNISYGLVGTAAGIDGFTGWAGDLSAAFYPPPDVNRRIWPAFPGFEAAFASVWPKAPTHTITLDERTLNDSAKNMDPSKRASGVVDLYLDAIERLSKRDDPINVVVCVVPDVVYVNCRPQSRVLNGVGYAVRGKTREQRAHGQLDLFDTYDPGIYQYSVDFRRQIKARSMKFGIPIQILRESTIETGDLGRRGLTPRNDRAWNLSVALYYKSGGKPWRLSSARPGVCYIGIAYRQRDQDPESRAACCAAQMFLDSGDGIVFMGEYGPWYSPERGTFRLARPAAKRLLEGVLQTYQQLEGKALTEIFLHSRSSIDDEEFEGFQDACPVGVKLVGIRVRQERGDIRLFREGSYPALRGSFWQASKRRGYLWGSGFKQRLATYDGWEVPVPLRIELQHGEVEVEQVARDILGLTKLNYNACRLGDSEPVTIGFSDAVGEILVSNPSVQDRRPNFKFYI